MRLSCPNCDAQYEIDPQVIPDSGRDVQCSNCGHTWYQRPPHLEDEAEEMAEPEFAGADDAGDQAGVEQYSDEESRQDTSDLAVPPERPGLDPEIATVLREEAALEAEARRRDAEALETQPDLGLEDSSHRFETYADEPNGSDHEAEAVTVEDEDEPPNEVAVAGSRRDLLPDIEEINSTLRASAEREQDDARSEPSEEQEAARGRRGFGIGFVLTVTVLLLAVLTYAFARQIGDAVPATMPLLADYVDWVNGIRRSVNTTIATWAVDLANWAANLTAVPES